MKKIFLFYIIFFLWTAGNILHAQQWHYHNPTLWFDINAVEIPAPGIIVIGGGHETNDSIQVMFQTSDYGTTWIENPHDGQAPWNKSIAFSDHSNGLAVGYDGRIIKTDDAGQDWGYSVYPIQRDLNKIVYAGAGTYYVAGGNKTNDSIQTILKSSDYGNSWSVIYDTLGPWLKSLYFTNTMIGFAVGDNGVVLSTTNGGNSWSPVSSPLQRNFNAITFINTDTGYIVGGTPQGLCRRTILRTVNGGLNWSVLIDTTGGTLKDVSFADELVGYTVGDSATVLKTTDGGSNWSPVLIDTSLNGSETFNAVKFHDKNFGVIGGKTGVLYIYLDLPVEPFTLGISHIGNADATLLGGINTHTKNASCSFVYSNNINFSTHITTSEINVRNDSLLLISEPIQGLTPNTTYYYFLKVTTVNDTVYGDTLSFFTGANPSSVLHTLDATYVTTWWAYLNGFINEFHEPVNLFFEYGRTPAFGTQVAATPSGVNDTLMHYFQTRISGLQADKLYFFRIKSVTGTKTYYGDTKMFYAVTLPSVNTGIVTNLTLTSAQLNGNINISQSSPVILKFDYGLTPYYGNEVTADPDTISGTGNYPVFALLTGLSQATYHYRIKAIHQDGISYGNDNIFTPGGPSASTFGSQNLGLNTVQLNGIVNANNSPTAISFEYGKSTLYGSTISSIPDSAYGNGNVYATVILTGLSQDTLYHFRVKATNIYGTNYGTDGVFILVRPGPGPIAITIPATNVTPISATLNGVVNSNHYLTRVVFEYGPTSAYGDTITAVPFITSDTNDIAVSADLAGLFPVQYHFRVKASNIEGTNYGYDMIFSTGTLGPAPNAVTKPATDITLYSAKLNGIVNSNHYQTDIAFEYGLTDSYGNIVPASPQFTNDTNDIPVCADLPGLNPDTYYHYRIKATNIMGTKCGYDLIFFTGFPEIPNFDFEIWDSTRIDFPLNWTVGMGDISKYAPACSGNYAVRMHNTPEGDISAITMGFVGDGVFGGVPFHARPDTISGCFNYNLIGNDSAWVVLILKKGNNIISMNVNQLGGNSGGNFVHLKFPVQYNASDIPDSLVLFLSSGSINQRTHSPDSWLIADDIHFSGTSLNIVNNDFEEWRFDHGFGLPGWMYEGKGMIPPDTNAVSIMQTTDASSNKFAARLRPVFQDGRFKGGILQTGNDANGKFPVNARHQSLTGYYKFSPQNSDTMNIQISMYKNGLQIGNGYFSQTNTISNYTPFTADVGYYSSDIPDSASIYIRTYNLVSPLGNSVLYIDNLNFDGFFTGIKEPVLTSTGSFDFNIYPNPFSNQATVSFTLDQDEHVVVRLFDLSGKQVALLADGKYVSGNYKFALSSQGLQKGYYICVINTEYTVQSRKLVIY